MSFPKQNNILLLRLIFAAQVVLSHTAGHLAMPFPAFVGHFPGVPAFFFVSGFLIYDSYQREQGWGYFRNRFLRLFPGLLAVTLGALAIALVARGASDLRANFSRYVEWMLAQLTIGQAYNPEMFHNVGTGEPNGSLWTITVEILFYICVPIIVWLERRAHYALPVLIALSFAVYASKGFLDISLGGTRSLYGALAITPIVWGWMFGVGIVAVKYFDRIEKYIKYFPWLAAPMLVMMLVDSGPFFATRGRDLGLFYFVCYAGLILWVAFRTTHVHFNLDLSYGAYVWHMPIINVMILMSVPFAPLLTLLLTPMVAYISWVCVEKPALDLKRFRPRTNSKGDKAVRQTDVAGATLGREPKEEVR